MTDFYFVYGTLKSKSWNNYHLGDSRLLANAETEEGYTLHQSGIPYMVKGTDETNLPVRGELYEVTDKNTKLRVDGLEGHPYFYRRTIINVKTEDGDTVQANAYIYQGNPGCELSPVINGAYEF